MYNSFVKEQEVSKECTFKPKFISSKYRKPKRTQRQLTEDLNKGKKTAYRLEAYQFQKEIEETAECTFKPDIRKSQNLTNTTLGSLNTTRNGTCFDRLHSQTRGMSKERREYFKALQEAEETKECTFSPKINESYRPHEESGHNLFRKLNSSLYRDLQSSRESSP